MMELQIIWFILIVVLLAGYAVLDGFDFGVGILHLFAKNEEERRLHINAIAPVWDGNEVWLLTGGGALFAAFPLVYATVFSGFYTALMLLLAALIFRAVSMEFRGKVDSEKWRNAWDKAFGIGSLLPALLLGVALGNIVRGIPIDAAGRYTGTFLGLLNPFAILVGLASLMLFVMHGAVYMMMKSGGELRMRMRSWASRAWISFILIYICASIAAIATSTFLFNGVLDNPLFWVLFVLMLTSLIAIPVALKADRAGRAFIGTTCSIVSIMGLTAVGLFPRLVPSSTNLDYSLTITNASSSQTTLTTMLVIALIGMPIVIAYTVVIYRIFKGKVVIGEDSY